MKIDPELLEIDYLVQNAEMAKQIILDHLLNDGVLTEDNHKIYSEQYYIVVIKRSWFKRLFGDDPTYTFKFVKMS
jgi:hypothetical protein